MGYAGRVPKKRWSGPVKRPAPQRKKKKKHRRPRHTPLPPVGTWVRIKRPPYGSGDVSYEHRRLYKLRATWLVVDHRPKYDFIPKSMSEPVIKRRRNGQPFLPEDDLSHTITYEEQVKSEWLEPVSPLEMLAEQADEPLED